MEEDRTYIKGFNSGYKLAQFTPDLWGKLKPALTKGTEYEKGVIEGAEEFEKSMQKNRLGELEEIRENKGKAYRRDIER